MRPIRINRFRSVGQSGRPQALGKSGDLLRLLAAVMRSAVWLSGHARSATGAQDKGFIIPACKEMGMRRCRSGPVDRRIERAQADRSREVIHPHLGSPSQTHTHLLTIHAVARFGLSEPLPPRRRAAILPAIVARQGDGMSRSGDVQTVRRWLSDGVYASSRFRLAAP
jgi:hypothetical protein